MGTIRENSCTANDICRTVKAAIPFFVIGKLFQKTDPFVCKEVRDTHKPDTKKPHKIPLPKNPKNTKPKKHHYTRLLRILALFSLSSNNIEMIVKGPPEWKEHNLIE